MNTRYLELDSTFRNRSRWPLPGQFEVEVSQSGTKNRITAVDPISTQAPTIVFNGSFDNSVAAATVGITGILPSTMGLTSNSNTFIITAGINDLRTEKNFYSGAVLQLTDNGVTPVTAQIRISDYEFLNNTGAITTALITSLDPLPAAIITAGAAASGTIYNPTDATNTVQPGVFIPTGSERENRYVNYCIENVTRAQRRTITSYDSTTHIAYFENDPAATWTPTDDYVLRRICPNITGAFVAVASASTMTIAVGSSTEDNFYAGSFLRINGPLPVAPFSVLPPPYNESRRIVSYDAATNVVTVSPPFTTSPLVADSYEILYFTRDNYAPVNYSGSRVSQQQAVCYEIQLVNLILPNKILAVGKGGLVAFYPYVYVELRNTNTGGSNLIYSNNPNSNKALFRCSIDDVNNPLISPFVDLDSNGMTQTVKFKPNDNFRFSVILPTGEVFQTVDADVLGPREPDPEVQISALFALKRLGNNNNPYSF